MKRIYYCVPGADSGHLLSKDGCGANSYGYYYFTDILGRNFRVPVANTFLFEEEWDGETDYLPNRYKDAVKEQEIKPDVLIKGGIEYYRNKS